MWSVSVFITAICSTNAVPTHPKGSSCGSQRLAHGCCEYSPMRFASAAVSPREFFAENLELNGTLAFYSRILPDGEDFGQPSRRYRQTSRHSRKTLKKKVWARKTAQRPSRWNHREAEWVVNWLWISPSLSYSNCTGTMQQQARRREKFESGDRTRKFSAHRLSFPM